jgi:hypothetical protein
VRDKGSVALSFGAVLSSLATLGCCLPIGFLAAAGAAGAGILLQKFRPWFMGLSVLFLAGGFVQQYRGARCGVNPSRSNVAILWIAAGFVLLMLLFPQEIAGFLADHLRWSGR